MYDDCDDDVDDDDDDYWWGCEVQWDYFQEVTDLVVAHIPAKDEFARLQNFDIPNAITVAKSALTHLMSEMSPHIHTYLCRTPFRDEADAGDRPVIGIRVRVVRGEKEMYHATLRAGDDSDETDIILRNAQLALISAYECGPCWANIEVRRLQSELQESHGYTLRHDQLIEDADEWDNCVQGFQNSLHEKQDLFGVLYRDRTGHEVVVKTTTVSPELDYSEDQPLKILVFWWNYLLTPWDNRLSSLLRSDYRAVWVEPCG